MTKVLTVRMPPALLSQADARAAHFGMDRTQYVRHLIQTDLASAESGRTRAFRSEDLAGRFQLGGEPATNARVRRNMRHRQQAQRSTGAA